MPLTTETLLAYSMGIIGTLLVLLISLVVYVFLTLREEVRAFHPICPIEQTPG